LFDAAAFETVDLCALCVGLPFKALDGGLHGGEHGSGTGGVSDT